MAKKVSKDRAKKRANSADAVRAQLRREVKRIENKFGEELVLLRDRCEYLDDHIDRLKARVTDLELRRAASEPEMPESTDKQSNVVPDSDSPFT